MPYISKKYDKSSKQIASLGSKLLASPFLLLARLLKGSSKSRRKRRRR